jgi:FkbH-like protein
MRYMNATEMAEHTTVKCVIWDLDNTIWEGTLLEDDAVTVRPAALELVEALDGRGILQSIASKNDPEIAVAKLRELDLATYFLYPQVGWTPKSTSVEVIARKLNISLDAVAFIDDSAVEREEVQFVHPNVMVLDARDLESIGDMPEMRPRFVTDESRLRRQMYIDQMQREQVEAEFGGPREDFLETLGLEFEIRSARQEDLQRAEELTLRTHQLNTTGRYYSYEQLRRLITSERHMVCVARLTDKFGTYGTIGLSVLDCDTDQWVLRLMLMSCRVMFSGMGTVMTTYLRNLANAHGVRLLAELRPTRRNRPMYLTLKFAGFREIERSPARVLLESDLTDIPPFPPYATVRILR